MLKAHDTSGAVLFEEKQKFPQWLTLLIIGIMVFIIAGMIVLGLTVKEERYEMWMGLAIAAPTEILVIVFIQKARLEKVVTTNGLYYRWTPWQKRYRIIEKEEIKDFELRNSPPFHYGFGWFPGYGKVHVASTGKGVQLYLVNGNRVYFSTFDTGFFQKALQNSISPNPKHRMSEF